MPADRTAAAPAPSLCLAAFRLWLVAGAAILLVSNSFSVTTPAGPLAAWLVSRLLRPLDRIVGGVADGIRSFRDRDFSVRLAYQRDDELGDLVRLYNDVGSLLQEERHLLRQRELLLQTALERSPAARSWMTDPLLAISLTVASSSSICACCSGGSRARASVQRCRSSLRMRLCGSCARSMPRSRQ